LTGLKQFGVYEMGMKVRFTTNLDRELILPLEKMSIALRNKGFSRFSKGMLISMVIRDLVDVYETDGIDDVCVLLKKHLVSCTRRETIEQKQDKRKLANTSVPRVNKRRFVVKNRDV